MSADSIASALREHHHDLQELVCDAEQLVKTLERPESERGELRDLLQREFAPDLTRPGASLWLETVIDDIFGIVGASLAEDVRELAEAIEFAAFDVSMEV